jgi:hypothetical protein
MASNLTIMQQDIPSSFQALTSSSMSSSSLSAMDDETLVKSFPTQDRGACVHYWHPRLQEFRRTHFDPNNVVYGEMERTKAGFFIPIKYRVPGEEMQPVSLRFQSPTELRTPFGVQAFVPKNSTADAKSKLNKSLSVDWALTGYDQDAKVCSLFLNLSDLDEHNMKSIENNAKKWWPREQVHPNTIKSAYMKLTRPTISASTQQEYPPQIKCKIDLASENPTMVYDSAGKVLPLDRITKNTKWAPIIRINGLRPNGIQCFCDVSLLQAVQLQEREPHQYALVK